MLEANFPVPDIPTLDIPPNAPARKKSGKKAPPPSTVTSGAFEAESRLHKDSSLGVAGRVGNEVTQEKDSSAVSANEGVLMATSNSEQKSDVKAVEHNEMTTTASYLRDGDKNGRSTVSAAPAKDRQLDTEEMTAADGQDRTPTIPPIISHIGTTDTNGELAKGSADAATLNDALLSS